jgi:osmotically-inducible protein OsmY
MENQEKRAQLERFPGINRFGEEHPRAAGFDFENERGMHDWSEDNRSEGVGGHRRSDEQIYESVLQALEYCADVETDEMQISVQKGTVYLAGYVPDKEVIFFAEAAVMELPAVRGVNNELKVKRNCSHP